MSERLAKLPTLTESVGPVAAITGSTSATNVTGATIGSNGEPGLEYTIDAFGVVEITANAIGDTVTIDLYRVRPDAGMLNQTIITAWRTTATKFPFYVSAIDPSVGRGNGQAASYQIRVTNSHASVSTVISKADLRIGRKLVEFSKGAR